MKKFFLIHSLFGAILLCYCPHSMQGQDVDLQTKTEDDYVHGFVLDAAGEPLPYANISVWEGNHFIKGTTSDQEGFFELAHCEAGQLKIEYIGYETKQLELPELRKKPLIQLQEQVTDLATVVVTTNRNYTSTTTGCPFTVFLASASTAPSSSAVAEDSVEWRCFPNPTTDYIQVSTPSESGTLRLFSNSGSLLKEQLVQSQACRLDISSYPAGAYFLSYQRVGEKVLSKRVIKVIL